MEDFTGVKRIWKYGRCCRTDQNCCYNEVFMNNGKKEGIEKIYRDGILKEEIEYINGLKHGIEKHYKTDKIFVYINENDDIVNAYVEFIKP